MTISNLLFQHLFELILPRFKLNILEVDFILKLQRVDNVNSNIY